MSRSPERICCLNSDRLVCSFVNFFVKFQFYVNIRRPFLLFFPVQTIVLPSSIVHLLFNSRFQTGPLSFCQSNACLRCGMYRHISSFCFFIRHFLALLSPSKRAEFSLLYMRVCTTVRPSTQVVFLRNGLSRLS